MKIVTLAASNSAQSINQMLVNHASDVFKTELNPEAEVVALRLSDYEMPIYGIDHEQAHGVPSPAVRFLEAIGDADALIFAFAEHNGNYTAAYKNVFDWASRLGKPVFQQKPMVALGTSPGPGGAQNVLNLALTSAPHFGADMRGSLSVPVFGEAFDPEAGVLVDADLAAALRDALRGLLA
ncbi:FMN reductase [Amylibacter marinus]|uniref:FMN reductase n=1 Tax=Amylibacter marinus TaxID=1475483 RepID=A0ABQ5VXF6_9RHOB|nr:NAD(P)H-dependent oxidoreductase [Amylibacter marinus]GLQ35824.1 FMN reductase [Amylibacter marinus]